MDSPDDTPGPRLTSAQSKNVNSAHQIIGLTIVACTIFQFSLGFIHHLIFKKTQRPTIMGRIHLYAGPFVLFMGAANGFLGFRFSSSNHNLMYGIICIAVFIGLVAVIYFAQSRKARRTKKAGFPEESYERYSHQRTGDAAGSRPRAYEERFHQERSGSIDGRSQGSGAAIQLEVIPRDDPPAYDEKPVRPRSLV